MDANPQAVMPAAFDEIDQSVEAQAAEPTPAAQPKPGGIAALHDIPVKVEAVLGGARMRIDALLAIGPGSIIELDRRVGEPVDVVVNGRRIARGELVLIDSALGVTLTEIVRQDG